MHALLGSRARAYQQSEVIALCSPAARLFLCNTECHLHQKVYQWVTCNMLQTTRLVAAPRE